MPVWSSGPVPAIFCPPMLQKSSPELGWFFLPPQGEAQKLRRLGTWGRRSGLMNPGIRSRLISSLLHPSSASSSVVLHLWSRRWSCLRKALWQMSHV